VIDKTVNVPEVDAVLSAGGISALEAYVQPALCDKAIWSNSGSSHDENEHACDLEAGVHEIHHCHQCDFEWMEISQ
jgi:hypothetical protein